MSGLRLRLSHAAKPFRQATTTAKVMVSVGLVIVGFFIAVALFGPMLSPYEPTQYLEVPGEPAAGQLPRLAEPSSDHLMGTNRDSFDVLARVIGGSRVALAAMLAASVLALGVGVPLGLLSGYRGGRLDRALVTIMDAIYTFPDLLLAIVVAFLLSAYFRPGVISAAAAVGIVYIPQYFRVVRNHTLSVKEEPFVEAARSLGAPERTVIGRYVFFNVVQSVPVILTLNAAAAILTLASLGFLGYGVPPPAPEWGYDISQATQDITSGVWWTATWPGLAIITLVAGLTLVGEGLNDVINPLLRARGMSGAKLDDGTAGAGPSGSEAAAESATGGRDDREDEAVSGERPGAADPDAPSPSAVPRGGQGRGPRR